MSVPLVTATYFLPHCMEKQSFPLKFRFLLDYALLHSNLCWSVTQGHPLIFCHALLTDT